MKFALVCDSCNVNSYYVKEFYSLESVYRQIKEIVRNI